MNDLPPPVRGDWLSPEEYRSDFFSRFWRIDRDDCWKLERIQSFQEHGSASWDAFSSGDRGRAFQLIQERRSTLAEHYRRVADTGFTLYRVRVVEEPISDYLQWELQSLCQRAELGERIGVVGGERIARYESDGRTLPELVTVGSEATYQVHYDDHGVHTGATLSTDADLCARWRELIQRLHVSAEDVTRFVGRKAAALEIPHAV